MPPYWTYSTNRKQTVPLSVTSLNGEPISVEFEEDRSFETVRAAGTYISAGFDSCGETRYFLAVCPNRDFSVTLQYHVTGRYWYTAQPSTNIYRAYETTPAIYNIVTGGNAPDPNPTYVDKGLSTGNVLNKVDHCSSNFDSNSVLSINHEGNFSDRRDARLKINLYRDGQLVLSNRYYRARDFAPPYIITPTINYYNPSSSPTLGVLNISKLANTQAIEVLPTPDKPHSLDVWKVTLNTDGTENYRSLYTQIVAPSGNSAPAYTVSCGLTDTCPENTCQVDCGTHYCCYGSDGIATHSFLK
ncbi:MAG: hypothetical protein ACFCU5_20925 [Pleurocapsa sp.]